MFSSESVEIYIFGFMYGASVMGAYMIGYYRALKKK